MNISYYTLYNYSGSPHDVFICVLNFDIVKRIRIPVTIFTNPSAGAGYDTEVNF